MNTILDSAINAASFTFCGESLYHPSTPSAIVITGEEWCEDYRRGIVCWNVRKHEHVTYDNIHGMSPFTFGFFIDLLPIMTSKCILIHYNAEWVEKEGNDTYDGCLQPVCLPDNYTVEDVMNKAKGDLGFMHGPSFHVYGLLFVPATGLRKRLTIISEETSKTCFYCRNIWSDNFFTIKSGEEVKAYLPPPTPRTADGGSSIVNNQTPLTPHSNSKSSSFKDNESMNEPSNVDSGGKAWCLVLGNDVDPRGLGLTLKSV
ncbi:hypothetical protein C5167_023300 [Papaver somniferum]|uniref:Uncharacterized protein n=1 Tax=Papaver somniferum TaxID=3469 RepID=A0A4Y7JLA7_PAPSO|nr:hypothetical protein C5167_023300 [Papaver somniferum]